MIRQIDRRSEPVQKMVALGESTTWGFTVSRKELCWVSRLGAMLAEFQGSPVEVINQGIGSNVLTPLCPSYHLSARPSALERLEGDVLAHRPDLLVLSYGLNDARGGTPAEVFRREYQKLIECVQAVYNPLIVILNVYYMHEELYSDCPGWEQSSYDATEVFNQVIAQLARANDLILADAYAAEEGVDWIIDQDHCHPNDLGHFLIANRVFEAIARNCSFVAHMMPRESLIGPFNRQFGNGPDRPSFVGKTQDIMVDRTKEVSS